MKIEKHSSLLKRMIARMTPMKEAPWVGQEVILDDPNVLRNRETRSVDPYHA
jgi:hypothetical protein